jgi:hypothetical protein
MKIQFGLRFVLLVVTLCATILAWRNAVNQSRLLERQYQIENLKSLISSREAWIDEYVNGFHSQTHIWRPAGQKSEYAIAKDEIAEMKHKLDMLQK